MKVGFVAILGRPNAGKSTLLNALLSKKVSIVTHKAQTTRDAISGILTEKDYQIVFVDTPGIFFGHQAIDQAMRKSAYDSAKDVNLILYLVDASARNLAPDVKILSTLRSKAPKVIVLNKIDLIRPERGEEIKALLKEQFPDIPIIEASILTNYGIKEIKNAVLPSLEEGDPYYPEDWITDKDMSYQAKEVIREKLLSFVHQEIPHHSAVAIDSFLEKEEGYDISATIFVERDAQKRIVIGKGGHMIEKIRLAALRELSRMWHTPIARLHIEVEVAADWRNDPKKLARLGYGER